MSILIDVGAGVGRYRGSQPRAKTSRLRDRKFADSSLEGNGFEPLVPGDMRMRLARDDQVKWSTRLSESIRAMPTPRLHMFAKSDRGAPLMDAIANAI
ncbi:MAG TPA: hypothetical protein VGN30_12325 [Steroidobacteraceae bacterium]